jgi:hypothetical protein
MIRPEFFRLSQASVSSLDSRPHSNKFSRDREKLRFGERQDSLFSSAAPALRARGDIDPKGSQNFFVDAEIMGERIPIVLHRLKDDF